MNELVLDHLPAVFGQLNLIIEIKHFLCRCSLCKPDAAECTNEKILLHTFLTLIEKHGLLSIKNWII